MREFFSVSRPSSLALHTTDEIRVQKRRTWRIVVRTSLGLGRGGGGEGAEVANPELTPGHGGVLFSRCSPPPPPSRIYANRSHARTHALDGGVPLDHVFDSHLPSIAGTTPPFSCLWVCVPVPLASVVGLFGRPPSQPTPYAARRRGQRDQVVAALAGHSSVN